jgi:nicotinamidase-related amidase
MAPTRSSFPRSRTAVVVIDAINPLDFDGGRTFADRAVRPARAIAALAARARRRRVPVVFVNDNFGRWRSDMKALLAFVSSPGSAGRRLVEVLRPSDEDFVVLKSTLSGFHQTPLEAMLRQGHVKTVVMAGFLTGNCVLFTAADAYMRGFDVVVASDCVLDETDGRHRDALKTMSRALKARVVRSPRLALRA